MKRVISIVTANSNSGAQCLRDLMTKYPSLNAEVRACFRSQSKADPFIESLGSHKAFNPLVAIDASDSASLQRAYAGATHAVIVTPHDHSRGFGADSELCLNMVDAAVAAKVQHIVYVGSWTTKAQEDIKIISSRFGPTEDKLKTLQNTHWTSLRSGYFYQNFGMALGAGVRAGAVSFPNYTIPAVDPRDMGRVAAAICAGDSAAHHGKSYEISGPELLTVEEVVAKISNYLGKPITFDAIPTSVLEGKAPPALWELFDYMEREGPSAIPFSTETQELCGEHTSFDQWLSEFGHIFTDPPAH